MSNKYDLFISFKNSQEDNVTKTIDSEEANRLFVAFRKERINIFFSNKVLSENGVANYMLEIQNALESSKVLLIVYSEISYITEGWVAHEWMTYLNLMMKDANRKIFLYSMKNTTSNIPPFLRPYECFTNYEQTFNHVLNSVKYSAHDSVLDVSKRFFLSAYWGLFNDNSFDLYCNRHISEDFDNHEAYCLKWKSFNGLSTEKFIEALQIISDKKKNPLVTYLLSMQFRSLEHLDLNYSNLLRRKAYKYFVDNIELKQGEGEIALIIIEDNYNHYNGAFYMCDVVNDVLVAYNIQTKIYIFKECNQYIDFSNYRKSVIFLSNTDSYIAENVLRAIYHFEDRILIGLNSFGKNAINYDFGNCVVFENTSKDITKMCRMLLS